MSNYTDLSDINELHMTFLLANKQWYDETNRMMFEKKYHIVGEAVATIQMERASVMANAFIMWSEEHGYITPVEHVWWTGRAGMLESAIQNTIDIRTNPTDVLVKFSSGPSDGLLGISAKSTGSKRDISFKNLGVRSIEEGLSLELQSMIDEITNGAVEKFLLPKEVDERKVFIRQFPEIKKETQRIGKDILIKIRDSVFDKLSTMQEEDVRRYILNTWLNASPDTYPPFVKVTGVGNVSGNMRATVESPIENNRVLSIKDGPISLSKCGLVTIGVVGGGKKVMKMRAKYTSEKLASSLKLMGEPW